MNSNPIVPKTLEDEEDYNAINNIIPHSPILKSNILSKNFYTNEIRRNKFDFNSSQVKRYEKMPLFHYRYYLFTSFIKNFDIRKLTNCFSKKFTKVYLFLSQMFDISSYLTMQREFQILKTTLFKGEDINIIEKTTKINVNERSFIRNMNECIDKGQFKIFSQNINKREKNI